MDCGSSAESLIQMTVATIEFGLPELRAHCIKSLASGLTADTACNTLITARSNLGNLPDESSVVREVEEYCVGYIEANTCAVFKSKGFLQLPKETLLSIIQSSKVCIYKAGRMSVSTVIK